MTRPDAPAGALLALLLREREVLLQGQLPDLAPLAAAKERLVAAFEAVPPAPEAARHIALAAREVETLLAAAMRGVDAARRRLDLARAGGPALSTYTAEGRAEIHPAAQGSLERRL